MKCKTFEIRVRLVQCKSNSKCKMNAEETEFL